MSGNVEGVALASPLVKLADSPNSMSSPYPTLASGAWAPEVMFRVAVISILVSTLRTIAWSFSA